MKRSWLVLGIVVVVVGGLALWMTRAGGEKTSIDLLQEFSTAAIKKPRPEIFSVVDATLIGATHKAIAPTEPSRIGWHVTVPPDAWLKLSIGMKPESWTIQGDGVVFQIGVTDGKKYEELLRVHVNPFTETADRQWKDLTLDLSPYSGQAVDLIFNTYASPDPLPGQPHQDDRNGDMPLWGAPRIVVK
jgi:hypothetical protein